ncbi:hypothetical protein [Subtercola vilae]|uniref:hypothetical protein n=1 Tax=Subtercola vilae TaxID=2056433 RepID=UPI0010A995BB|nr:hypothetical protein [Subtercola vilae]
MAMLSPLVNAHESWLGNIEIISVDALIRTTEPKDTPRRDLHHHSSYVLVQLLRASGLIDE